VYVRVHVHIRVDVGVGVVVVVGVGAGVGGCGYVCARGREKMGERERDRVCLGMIGSYQNILHSAMCVCVCVCCSVLQCVAVCLGIIGSIRNMLHSAMCVLQCVAVCCSMLHLVAVCYFREHSKHVAFCTLTSRVYGGGSVCVRRQISPQSFMVRALYHLAGNYG